MKILVWLPLQESSAWRGEGIAQTIEHIVSNTSSDIEFHFIGNNETLQSLHDCLEDKAKNHFFYKCNIFLTKYSHKTRREIDPQELMSLDNNQYIRLFFERFFPGFDKISNILTAPFYLFKIKLYSYLISRNIIFKHIKFVWAPIPSIPFIESLGKKTIINIWDFFVLEYSEFEVGLKNIISNKFSKLFINDNYAKIITQSEHNKKMMEELFNAPNNKINVIGLGSPDYARHLTKFKEYRDQIISRNFEIKIDFWKEPKYYKPTGNVSAKKVLGQYYANIANKALALRLLYKIKPNTKIILISTQNRPYKGLSLVIDLLNKFRSNNPNLHVILMATCQIHQKVKEKYPYFYDDIFEFSRVSNFNHAFLYSISDLVLHSSFIEGGLGSYSMFEAASVGVPSLTNDGRHTAEMCAKFPKLKDVAFCNFSDTDLVEKKILKLLINKEAKDENTNLINSCARNWNCVSKELFATFK